MARSVDHIIDIEVLKNVSGLIATLASACGGIDGRSDAGGELVALAEQAAELAMPVDDYEEAAIQAGWERGKTPNGLWFNATIYADFWSAATTGRATFYATAEELCGAEDLEPYQREVFEFWLISGWLGQKLEARGEKVDFDFAGLTVWARSTTGQALILDQVFHDIVADWRASMGRVEKWTFSNCTT